MAFSVNTYTSEQALAEAIQATVTTYADEDSLGEGILNATLINAVVVKGMGKYTLIDDAQIPNVSLRILAKGAFYTVILETA